MAPRRGVLCAREVRMNRYLNFRKCFVLIFFCACLSGLSGCVYLVVGGIGALGGYVVSPDTVEGTTNHSFAEVWDAASDIVPVMGRLIQESEKEGKMKAIINNSKVTVSIVQYTPNMAKLSVKARKSFFPNITTAQDVYIKIMSNF